MATAAMAAIDAAIDAVHRHTAIFTRDPVIDRLIRETGWPERPGVLLDPGAGFGDVVLRAITHLDPPADAVDVIAERIEAWEFHPDAARTMRSRISDHLVSLRWSVVCARTAAAAIVRERDFLADGPAPRRYAAIVGNPPYIRRAGIPPAYRAVFDASVPDIARADMMHAYLEACARLLDESGTLAMVTSDRWLFNAGAARLRETLGLSLEIGTVERLSASSAFHVVKERRRGTPPRVHPVIVVATRRPSGTVSGLTSAPYPIGPADESVPTATLGDRVRVILAPWMGKKGIFTVPLSMRDEAPGEVLPCVQVQDVDPHEDRLKPLTMGVLRTTAEKPSAPVLAHLDATIHAMAPKGRRTPYWLPPTGFAHKLPLDRDAVLVPRIARRLRAIPLPAGTVPIGHNLVILAPIDPDRMIAWLNAPAQQAWIARHAPSVDGDFLSITASLLRRMPADDLEETTAC